MKFEDIIKKISALVAGGIVFFLAAGMYLSFKGFVMNPDGSIVLVNEAVAKTVDAPKDLKALSNLPKNHVLGDKKAPVTIYEYSSLGCYHCADFHSDILPKIQKDYIEKGKVKLVFADFPLDKRSMKASMLARCFSDSEKYYNFLNHMFKKQREWGLASNNKFDQLLTNYGVMNGLDGDKIQACLSDESVSNELADIRQQAIGKLGLKGTPSFLIVSADERELIEGAPKYLEFKKIIEKMLGENSKIDD
jgi:protein-disulfide isomerase